MLIVAFGCSDDASSESNYLVGRGVGDITGPTVDVPLWGFQRPEQIANGVHTRLRARAFIIGAMDGDKRLVFVTAELGSMSHEIRLSVLENLQAKYGDLYTLDNVVLSATHTHAGPTGYHHFLSQTTFYQRHFDAVVSGITKAIDAAHEDLSPGRIFFSQGNVEGGGANRSLPAYLNNPQAERARYANDTDKEMTLLKFEREEGVVGVLNWFAVHPTSLTFNNTLVSGDHKGFASFGMEQQVQGRNETAENFVAAFAQSNAGDVTSNAWKDEILFPELPADATPAEAANFERRRTVSELFGGKPRTDGGAARPSESALPKVEPPAPVAAPHARKKHHKEGC
jgi:neutral ceramidase